MHIHRILSLTILLGVCRVGLGQTAPAPTHEDSTKGQIWTATARRVWADEKATAPATKWATGTDFSKWVLTQPNDKAELGSLWKAVRDQVGKDQPATPAQLAKAILTEITKRKASKTGALAKVNLQSLQVDLEPFVPAGSTSSAVAQAVDSTTPAATQPASASRTVAEDENPAPEGQVQPAPSYTVQPAEPRYFGMPPGLAGAVLAILGALLGFGIATSRLKSKRHHRQRTTPTPPPESETSSVMTSPEYRKLYKQNENLTKQLSQLTKEVADLKKQLAGALTKDAPVATSAPAAAAHISNTSLAAAAAAAQASETPPPVVSASPEATSETDDALFSVTLTVPKGISKAPAPDASQSATPQPAATRYGPVQESAFLEERKIVDAPLPQLALMLTVNPRNPDQASFTLNPNVDQARLIGDGLTRLQKFFDYDPPLGGRITLVAAAAPGQLQRQADGWQVVQRARLNIS
jgi:hypothetical protein